MTAGINFGGKNFPPLKVSCVNSQLWWLSSMRNPWEKLSCPKTFRARELKMKTFCHVRPVSLKRVQLEKKNETDCAAENGDHFLNDDGNGVTMEPKPFEVAFHDFPIHDFTKISINFKHPRLKI